MKIVLPNERPISWNTYYAGAHWIIRKKKATEIHTLVKYALMEMGYHGRSKLIAGKVNIKVIAYFKNRPYDSDNIPAKLYVDGLKDILIQDDTYRYVGDVTTRSEIDKQNPRVEIVIEEEGR